DCALRRLRSRPPLAADDEVKSQGRSVFRREFACQWQPSPPLRIKLCPNSPQVLPALLFIKTRCCTAARPCIAYRDFGAIAGAALFTLSRDLRIAGLRPPETTAFDRAPIWLRTSRPSAASK